MADDDLDTDALSDKLKQRLNDVIREQAERLSQAQRQALQALEQSPDETGHLEESCRVEPGENELEWVVLAGGPLTTTTVREGSGKPYDYADAFEFGTSHQPARPFFYSTYNAMRDDMQKAIEDAISEVLNDD
ncbi:HK97 gp10 family phage protein [Bradyrhizobium sp. cir1]|uniref:HK97-gp10 family putative phage morphogenesis protein n=1 Tax=Bradyrhizobium sp. cir1 TaxID=1445730 RepID=UPI001605CCC9|nr:HK97-gp10 family putative phage morphogenesis protein [Bradyrhizobium sp. cir1]MBB4373318.1 HK97 gp10 family phage protein [Bradyrhizobium sp. cir1]